MIEKKKKKKSNNKIYTLLNIVGVLFIVTGLVIGGSTLYTNWKEGQETSDVISSWENLPIDDEGDGDSNTASAEGSVNLDSAAIWGVVEIPDLDVKAPISAAFDWTLLRRYVVPFESGEFPDEEGGNFSLASHWGSQYCSYCYFRSIKNLEIGAVITVYNRTTIYTYEVYESPKVIDSSDIEILDPIDGQTTLTLITCVKAKDPRRTVVQAKLVSSSPRT